MLKLEVELAAAGCECDPAAFREIVRGMFEEVYGDWTDEDLLHRPREGLRFCNLIRYRVGCETLDDYVILRVLTNVRKRGSRAA